MSFSLFNRVLFRGMVAGAVVLTGTACSRSDRAESGQNNSAAVLPDTSNNADQVSGGAAATGAVSDTTTTSAQSDPTKPSSPAQSNSPRAETVPPSDKDAAGYRPMERDTTAIPNQHADSARVTEDTAETSSASSDTSMSAISAVTSDSATAEPSVSSRGYAEMARDTSTVADQPDTSATANGDVALQASTDTSSQVSADTTAETSVATADVADTAANAGRIRPPEDSTEILGEDEAADETADEQVVRPEDRETAAADTRTEEVGAAAVGGDVTGAEAVALMSRAGVRCAVVDPEANGPIRWDMSSTPANLNPCGMGSMILSRIWTRVE